MSGRLFSKWETQDPSLCSGWGEKERRPQRQASLQLD